MGVKTQDPQVLITHLRELIDALDRRMDHIEQQGEFDIAKEAAALKTRAVARLAELERKA